MAEYVTPVKQFLKSIDIQPYERYLPNAFNDSLSLLEKVNKVIYQLNESNQLTNEVAKKWNDFAEWVNTGNIENIAETKLNEMLTDETLVELIDSELMTVFKTDIQTLTNEKITTVTTNLTDNLKSRGKSLSEFPLMVPESDDTGRLKRALKTDGLLIIPYGDYTVSQKIDLLSNTSILGYGGKITQKSNNTPIFDGVSIQNIFIEGLVFKGVGTDYTKNSGSLARAININGDILKYSKNINIKKCEFYDFGYCAIALRYVDGFDLSQNLIVGTGLTKNNIQKVDNHQFGIWISEYCSNGYVEYNDISQTAQGVFNGYDIYNVKYIKNHIHDIPGQHGFYISHGNIMDVHNNVVTNCALMGIKIQQAPTSRTIAKDISIMFNKVRNCGEHGIMSDNTDTNKTYQFYNVTIAFNEVTDCGAEGFSLGDLINSKFISNKVINSLEYMNSGKSRHGLNIINCKNVELFDYTVENVNGIGICVNTGNENITLEKIRVKNAGQSNTPNSNYGFIIQSGLNITVNDLDVSDQYNKSLYSFALVSGSNIKVRNSKFKNKEIRFFDNTGLIEWENNEVLVNILNYPTRSIKGFQSSHYHGVKETTPNVSEFKKGDIYYHTNPVAGGYVGKVVIDGNWKNFGLIES